MRKLILSAVIAALGAFGAVAQDAAVPVWGGGWWAGVDR